MASMLSGKLKDIKQLDKILSRHYPVDKDSSNGTRVYTKTYLIGKYKKIRLFFDERENTGTVKFKGNGYTTLALYASSTFTLIQSFSLILLGG